MTMERVLAEVRGFDGVLESAPQPAGEFPEISYGWVCVVNPGPVTLDRALAALRDAHADDRRRVERRQAT
ncbi:DUF6194 family protein [Microbacterium sp. X-17]|uniref:DUF6194 family protein n=1 Tax=Microbacterium sp. X-17 TaxID=3144404 RepID=UPI0031F56B23